MYEFPFRDWLYSMLHLEYYGTLGSFVIDMPSKIICMDNRFPLFYGKLLELEVDNMFEEQIAKVSNWVNYEWLFAEELLDLIYIDYDRVKYLKAFL